MTVKRKLSLAALALLAATAVHGADMDTLKKPGFELGIGIGDAIRETKVPGVARESHSTTGFNIIGGYRFDRYVSVEAGYLHGGSFRLGDDGIRMTAAQLSAVGALPLGNYVSLYARAGVDHWWTTNFDTTNRLLVGAGAQVFFDGALVRLEYQQSKFPNQIIGDNSVEVRHQYIAASVVWLF